jgi:hypothetical protein
MRIIISDTTDKTGRRLRPQTQRTTLLTSTAAAKRLRKKMGHCLVDGLSDRGVPCLRPHSTQSAEKSTASMVQPLLKYLRRTAVFRLRAFLPPAVRVRPSPDRCSFKFAAHRNCCAISMKPLCSATAANCGCGVGVRSLPQFLDRPASFSQTFSPPRPAEGERFRPTDSGRRTPRGSSPLCR